MYDPEDVFKSTKNVCGKEESDFAVFMYDPLGNLMNTFFGKREENYEFPPFTENVEKILIGGFSFIAAEFKYFEVTDIFFPRLQEIKKLKLGVPFALILLDRNLMGKEFYIHHISFKTS